MKLMKQALALLLCFLLLTNGPISAFATETVSGNDAAAETTATEFNQLTVSGNVAASCNECGAAEGHLETCTQYKAPAKEAIETAAISAEKTADSTVSGNDAVGCTCEPIEGVHQEGCKFYEAPVKDIAEITGPQVGDKIWIKHNSYVYKSQLAENGHKLLLNYEVEIVNIITDEKGNAIWYEFAFVTTGIGELLIREYKYVQVENTSVEEPEPSEPVDEHICNCGENAPENIADHADSCPRKQYIKTLFEGKTAEAIYTQWETYDEATQTDLLNMLQKWDNVKYEELSKLVNADSDGSDSVVTEDGNTVAVNGIPEKTQLRIGAPDESDMDAISRFMSEQTNAEYEVAPLFAYDITIVDANGEEWQPGGEPVTVTLTIPGLTMGLYQQLQIAHMHDGEIKMMEDVAMDLEKDTISFTTDGFSTFVGSFVDFSNGVKNSIMLLPGTAEPLEDILEAIDPEIYGKYDKENVSSVTVSPADCGITWNASYAITASTEFGYDEATLTVEMIDKTYTIRVLRGEAIFALEGAHKNWNQATTTTEKVKAYGTEIEKSVKAFSSTIYVNSNNYTSDNDDVLFGSNYRIYMRPGMAVTISHGLHLYTDTDNPTYIPDLMEDNKNTYEEFDAFTWMWESPINYIIAKDVSEYTVARFQLRNGVDTTDTRVRTIELHIIPDNEPQLLRDYLNTNQNDVTKNYSIKEVPATLFDYDGLEWNKHYKNTFGDGYYLAFVNQDAGKSTDPSLYEYQATDSANGGGNANQGLLHWKLNDNGLPVMQQTHKVDLFSTTEINGSAGQPNAKEVYENVGFEFIYDSDGYYNYNSELNHAQYNASNKKIELYTQSLSPSDSNNITYNWADQNPKAGFYPFADINEAFHSIDATGMTVEQKLEKLENSVDLNNRLNSDLAKDFVHSNRAGSTVGMFYGIHVHSDFYLPADKKLNGKEMVYEFTGDDDLWVFIDGQLVLDVGGGHTPVSGSFNLTTGEVWVERFAQLNSDAGGYYTTPVTVTNLSKNNLSNDGYFEREEQFLKGLKDDQMHTISIFYLERFAGESNCRMRFNLPLVPSESVHVSKNLVNQEGLELSVTPDVDYTFTIYTADDDDDNVNASNFAPYANQSYTVMGTGAPTDTQYTDSNGEFKLKDGWTATFPGIDRFTEVYVIESKPKDGYIYTDHTISVNKGPARSYTLGDNDNKPETKVMQLNQSITFDFVNKMKTQPLTVEKQVVNGTTGLIDPGQKFEFTLDFTKPILEKGTGAINATDKANAAVALTDGSTFQLGHNERVTIPRVPVNMTFTLKEANPDGTNNSFDAPQFSYVTCTTTPTPNSFDTPYLWMMCDGEENKITVTNQQRFNLTITKKGIQDADHDNDEKQSTIYTIEGKNGNDEQIVKMDVAICGNDSVTICKLPVGRYTVTENKDWAWRYEPKDENADDGVPAETKNVTIPKNAAASVLYENERKKLHWLSGDCYIENWWGGNNGTIKKRNGDDEVIEEVTE